MSDTSPKTIDTLLQEHRQFAPPEEFRAQANFCDPAVYASVEADWQGWWAYWADRLSWDTPYQEVLTGERADARWFTGGRLNASVQCLDRHVAAGQGERVAFHWEGEPGDRRTLSYAEMLAGTCRVANALKSLGVTTSSV